MSFFIIYLMGTPALIMLLARRWHWIDKVSPMAVLYVIGLLVANLTPWLHDSQLLNTNNLIGNICIPLAIPLMLVSCSLTHWHMGKAIKAFLSGLVAVLIVTLVGFFLFRGQSDSNTFAQVCAVAVGIYTGGIPNMGAIAQGVGMSQTTYLYVTSYDLIITGLYLVFVICFGKPLFRRMLGQQPPEQPAGTFRQSNKPTLLQQHIFIPMVALLIAVASYLLSTLFPDSLSTPMLILILTTLSITVSLLPQVRRINQYAQHHDRQPTAFTAGLYFVHLFCFSIANACDVRQMDLAGSLNILWYILFIIFGSLLLQVIFAKLLKLDGDTTLVTSVALINSPPFVPLVAALLNNKEVIVLGITIGLLGYMLGNYLGIAVYFILTSI